MGIEDDIRIDEQADDFMSKPPQIREKLLYVAVLNNDQMLKSLSIEVKDTVVGLKHLSENGCKRFCESKETTAMQRWTPAAVMASIPAIVVAVIEYFRINS